MDHSYEYDIAFSFAGEDREYVEKVAELLRKKEVRVFYDKFEAASLWGKNLYTHLSNVYQYKARYTVIFISRYYSEKLWTNHERENAQARAFKENKEYILPARFDATEIPGLLTTTGYIDLNNYSPREFAELIYEKLSSDQDTTVPPSAPSTDSTSNKPKPPAQGKPDRKWWIIISLIVLALVLAYVVKSMVDHTGANERRALAYATVTFVTLDDNKDFDTRLAVTLLDNKGNIAASATIADNTEFTDSSIQSFSLPINQGSSIDDLLAGKLKIDITPNGNDNWHFRPKLELKLQDGTTMTSVEFGDVLLSRANHQCVLSIQSASTGATPGSGKQRMDSADHTPLKPRVDKNPATGVSSTVFSERFENNPRGWGLGNYPWGTREIKEGKLIISVNQPDGRIYVTIPDINIDPDSSFSMEVITRWLGNKGKGRYAGYGIFRSPLNFFVYANGDRRLIYEDPLTRSEKVLEDWGGESSGFNVKNAGVNILKLIYDKGIATFYANDHSLFSDAAKFQSRSISLVIEGGERIEFDNIIIKRIQK